MSDLEVQRADHLDWALAGRPMPGEAVSGDLATVEVVGDQCIFAVVDGAGHGSQAAEAAEAAGRAVRSAGREAGVSVNDLLEAAHRSLRGSRGAALTAGILDGPSGTLHWAGVGDVDGVVVRCALGRPTEGVLLRGGVVGHHMPTLPTSTSVQLEDGDCLVVATDGIGVELADIAQQGFSVDRLARFLVDRASSVDDALVLVARYRSTPVGSVS